MGILRIIIIYKGGDYYFVVSFEGQLTVFIRKEVCSKVDAWLPSGWCTGLPIWRSVV